MLGGIRSETTIKEDSHFRLSRVALEDGRTLLAKTGVSGALAAEEKWLQSEFRLLKSLDADWALRPLKLGHLGERAAVFYRDIDASQSSVATQACVGLEPLLARVRALCALLEALHQRGVLLLGMTPDSFLCCAGEPGLVLTDALYAHWGKDTEPIERPSWALPYLRYVAPEIIHSVGRAPDRRADLYALGAVIYEWIAGRPPFDSADPAELIQCHLARRAPPLEDIAVALPSGVLDAVDQLLSKEPAQRPQDCTAFLQQLERGLHGNTPARSDAIRGSFRLSHALHGRDEILQQLLSRTTTVRVAPSITFIEGAAGMGKTALLRALRDRHVERPGQLCSGRFHYAVDPTPLSSWAHALGELADAILTKDRAHHDRFRNAVSSSLGEWAPLIAVLAPQWQAILGDAAPTQSENPDASIARLALAVHRLLRCFAEVDGSVVIMLDDLQWADASSLRILELVLTAPEPINLQVVATRRLDDAVPDHELVRLRERLTTAGIEVQVLCLAPLTAADIRDLFEDSLLPAVDDATSLSELALAKTGGSPLFVREFLALTIERRVLGFDDRAGAWRWTLREIQALPVADNVSQFLVNKISALADDVRTTLRLAACIGIEFSVEDFSVIFDMPQAQVCGYLEQAAVAGLLRSREQSRDGPPMRSPATAHDASAAEPARMFYEFVHDRVFEAAQALNSDAERESLHLHIGRRLSGMLGHARFWGELYRVARHFNAARRLITTEAERLRCAQWNLEVGNAARLRGAYSQALDSARAAMDYVECSPDHSDAARDRAWREHFDLTLSLHLAAAEAALLHGQHAFMYGLCEAALSRLTAPLSKVPFYDLRISGYKAQGRFADAVHAALDILSELGVRFPSHPRVLHILAGYFTTKRRLFAAGLAALRDLPALKDPEQVASARIIHAVYPAAYLGSPQLFPLLVYRHVNDSITYGNSPLSAVTYAGFAAVLCAMGDFDRALLLGHLALTLLWRLDAKHLKARVYSVVYFLLFPWKHPLNDSAAYHLEGIQAGLEHGDVEFSCYMMNMYGLARLHSGGRLHALAEEFVAHREKIASLVHGRSLVMQNLLCQFVSDLRTETPMPRRLAGPYYDMEEMLPKCMAPLDENMVLNNHLSQLMLAVFLDDPQAAYASAVSARVYGPQAAFGAYIGAIFVFYEALAYLAQPLLRQSVLSWRVARNARRLKRWAESAPMNFLHKYHLVEAERCRVLGRDRVAVEHYERAIELGTKHGYIHEVALAQELAGRYHIQRKLARLGRHYLRDAFRSYQLWGANAKIKRMIDDYPALLDAQTARSTSDRAHGPAGLLEALDYRAVLKSSQAISSEILLPRLLAKLLHTLLEHAGAQRGVLLLEARGELHVEFEVDIDSATPSLAHHEHLEDTLRVSRGVVHYAARTERPVVLANAALEGAFTSDPYVVRMQPRSLLCAPILHQGRLLGLVYLENNRMSYVFNAERLEVINLLASQAAISIANARYHTLQLEAQQAKINPHFLFNALSSIADLTLSDGQTAERAIVNLASLYRYILTSSATTMVTLDQELQVVRKYLSLEKLRFGTKLEFQVIHDGNAALVSLPGLLIQPLVENAIRHSIAPRVGPGVVSVEAHVADGTCCIVVQDDGDGVKHATAGTGFGLRSVQERLSLVYGTRYSFAISRAGGYRVELEIPTQLPAA